MTTATRAPVRKPTTSSARLAAASKSAAQPAPASPKADRNTVAAWLVGGLVAVLLLSWVGVETASSFFVDARPRPVWVDIKPVQAQMLDGRMVGVKVTLQLQDKASGSDIESYKPAIAAVIQQIGAAQTRAAIFGKDGMERFRGQIGDAVNDYLEDHELGRAVKQVSFSELIVMPVGEIH